MIYLIILAVMAGVAIGVCLSALLHAAKGTNYPDIIEERGRSEPPPLCHGVYVQGVKQNP